MSGIVLKPIEGQVAPNAVAERSEVGMPPVNRAPRRKPTCRHCGAALIDARMLETGFCCAGCRYVYRLVHEHGLAGYYQIKDDITPAADAAVFEPRDYTWLEEAQQSAEAAETKIPELNLDVQGISCAGCVWLIERLFQQQPGARDVFVNAAYGTIRLRWVRGAFSAADFGRKLQGFGYLLGPAGETTTEPESRSLVRRMGLCAAFAMNAMLFSLPTYFGMKRSFEWAGLFGLLAFLFGTLSVTVGGTYFIGRAVRALREHAMHIDLPIAIGIVGAYLGSVYGWLAREERFVYFDFVSTFILLMLVGRWAQTAAVERNRRRLLANQPQARRVRLAGGSERRPEQIQSGDRMEIAAGQTMPVEARLQSAFGIFSLASINGEAEPRMACCGARVPSGAVNIGRDGVLATALQPWGESLLAELLAPGDRGNPRQLFLERIVRGYVIGIILVALGAGLIWWVSSGDGLRAGAVVTAVLVVSCPCAIGLAFPLADEMAAVALRRSGIFVRDVGVWPKLSRVRSIVFDKTGTLTIELPVLVNASVLEALDPADRSALFALVRDNPHPIAESIRSELLARGAVVAMDGAVTEEVGFGVEMGSWSLGRSNWKTVDPIPPGSASGWAIDSRHDGHRQAGGGSVGEQDSDAVFMRSGTVLARFRFADRARADATVEIAALRRRGLSVSILSGDRPEKVAALAASLGLPPACALAGLSPQAKAKWLEMHGADETLMLGDGANDSLAFDRALCRGTPVIHRGVLERKADFYYLGRGIAGLRTLLEADVIRRRTHVVILLFSIAYNLLAVGVAVMGRMNPLVAAVLMPVNSLLTLAIVTTRMRRVFGS